MKVYENSTTNLIRLLNDPAYATSILTDVAEDITQLMGRPFSLSTETTLPSYNMDSSNSSLLGLLITSADASTQPPSMKEEEELVVRNRAKFCTSKWTKHFTEYTQDNICNNGHSLPPSGGEEWHKIELLKAEVNAKLQVVASKPLELLRMLDAVGQLGLGYLFETEMKQGFQSLFTADPDGHDLYHTSLYFRLLRQHGFKVPPSMFNRFLDKEGELKKDIQGDNDVLGMVSLYEAAQLAVNGDSLLEAALPKIISCMKSMATDNISLHLRELISNSLKQPIHKDIPWLRARKFISTYQDDEGHDETLLRLAKYHFNFVQGCHRQELSSLAKWWKDADVGTKLHYARDRLVESYMWSLIIYYEPKYSLARRIYTLVIAHLAFLDDTYDAYGTDDELELITETIHRWDKSLFDQMPFYARYLCQILFHLYDTIEEDLAKEGKPTYCLPYLKESTKILAQSYYNEHLWLKKKQIPTMDEYRHLAFTSSGATCVILYSLAGMGDIVPKAAYDWIYSDPKIVVASQLVCRFQDDIVSHEFEHQRDHIPSAVECYMNQHGVSDEEACKELSKDIADAWKDINEGCLRPTIFPFSVMERILNFNRLVHVLYRDGDSMTHPALFFEDKIVSLLVDSVPI